MNKYWKIGLIILLGLAIALGLLRRNTHILGDKTDNMKTEAAADKSLEQYYQQAQQMAPHSPGAGQGELLNSNSQILIKN